MKNNPLILDMKGNSLDDGPGIRTVIFFKGCPLNCSWCHNPESKKSSMELSYDPGKCIHCEKCIELCPEYALSEDNKYFIDRTKCTLCMKCTEVCPSGALEQCGKTISVKEITESIVKDKPFFDTSGGGVTLSGGEATLNIDFLSQQVTDLESRRINILLETCGQFRMAEFLEKIYLHINEIYFDIKLFDDGEHREHCGTSNKTILENFIILHDKYLNGGIPILPRIPLVPGITDSEKNLISIAEFLSKQKVKKVSLLSYNPLWGDKTFKIGKESELLSDKKFTTFMDETKIQKCRDIFISRKIELV